MRLLIAGLGYLGGEVARRALERGHEVVGRRSSPTGFPEGVRACVADLADPASLDLPRGIDAAVFCAAPDARTEDAYERTYVQGLNHLLAALQRAGAARAPLLFTGSTAVYGQREGEEVTEESPVEPAHFTGQLLLEAERRLRQSSSPGACVRLGGLYGPGRLRLLRSLADERLTVPETFTAWTNRIHRDDAARILLRLLEERQLQPIYNGVDPRPAPSAEVYGHLAEAIGAAPCRREDPATLDASFTNKRVLNAELARLGFRYDFPSYVEGYAGPVAEFLEQRA
jgi:nucleoside-diphosphate-sugar epimerase